METKDILGLIVGCAIGVIFILVAIFLFMGKGSFLIAGYNTMSQEEKNQYDKNALCRFMSVFMGVIGICIIVTAFFTVLDIKLGEYITLAIMNIVIVSGLIYCNTGNRFKKK